MSFSTSNYYTPNDLRLTSEVCSRGLTNFFHSSLELSIATEASSHPSGLVSLFGQPYVYAGGGLGNMDECSLQVCLAGGTQRDSLTFASVCIPEECTALDLGANDFLEKLELSKEGASDMTTANEYMLLHRRIAELNNFLNTGWTCGEYHVPFYWLPFGGTYLLLLSLLIVLMGMGTFLQRTTRRAQQLQLNTAAATNHQFVINSNNESLLTDKNSSGTLEETLNNNDYPSNDDDNNNNKNNNNTSHFFDLIVSNWNVRTNVQRLLVRKSEDTACLDGLRVGSILWVILGHIMAIQSSAGGGYNNPAAFLPPNGLTTTFFGQLLFSARFAVDTFLFISGFLVVLVMCIKIPLLETTTSSSCSFGERYLRNIPKLVLNRWMRIMPLYGISLGFWIEIAPHLGSGPFWYQWESLLEPCRKFGWTNWLFVNNLYPFNTYNVETCFYHSWYLALDFQLFFIAPLLVFWYQQHPKGGMIATMMLILLSVVTTMYLAYTRSWSINTFDGAKIARFDMEGYAKPHVRAQTYLAGMLLGMILQEKKKTDNQNNGHQNSNNNYGHQHPSTAATTLRSRLMMTTALSLLGTITFIPVTGAYARRACKYSELPESSDCGSLWSYMQTFWYAGMSRAVWSVGISLICYLCLEGNGGIINRLLSLKLWTPLSQLSFGVYLIHPIVIFVEQLGDRQKEPFRLTTYGYSFISVSMVSFALSLVLALLVEIPCARLVQLVVATNKKKKSKTAASNVEEKESNILLLRTTTRYSDRNYYGTISLSERKMKTTFSTRERENNTY